MFGAIAAVVMLIAFRTQRYMRSVSDFLAAGRTARRFLLTVTAGATSAAAVRIIGTFEMVYKAGFTTTWWPLLMPVNTFISLTGFVVYRFRETRALTLAQFLEIRYSKRLRIFAGLLMFTSGVLNMGIFPAVGARFFVYFCGWPELIHIGSFTFSTIAIVTVVLVIAAVYLTLGGQITLLFTEFFEGITTHFALLVILGFLLWKFDWPTLTATLMRAPAGQSMLNPFNAGTANEFDIWYFIIAAITGIYGTMAWQGNQGANAAPASAHEARMGKILGLWREVSFGLVIVIIPITAYILMHHPGFTGQAQAVNDQLATIQNAQVQSQVIVPIALTHILPVGLKGLLCAVMFCGFVGSLDTYLHSWGSIFVQDVVLPFRKTPFQPETHIRLLRWSIAGVSAFITLFSLLYQPAEFIVMFQIATGAIYLAGAGAIIIGGLYWNRGTTAGAWTAMISGALVMGVSITIRQLETRWNTQIFKQPNPQYVSAIAILISSLSYVLVSLATCRKPFDLQRMLHRGAHSDHEIQPSAGRKSLLRFIGVNHEFTRGDKLLAVANTAWAIFWFVVALSTTLYASRHPMSDEAWSRLWQFKSYLATAIGVLVTAWFAKGGLSDLKFMVHRLRTMTRNTLDDGMVIGHQNLDEAANTAVVESITDDKTELEKAAR